MKRLFALLTLLLTTTLSVEAQSVRLGERIPDIHTDSELGKEFELATKEYVYMVFVHSKSKPSLNLVDEINSVNPELLSNIDVVLVTTEDIDDNAAIVKRFDDNIFPIAYDLERRTCRNFGINYVPFGVVYDTKRKRALWFGSSLPFEVEEVVSQIYNTSSLKPTK